MAHHGGMGTQPYPSGQGLRRRGPVTLDGAISGLGGGGPIGRRARLARDPSAQPRTVSQLTGYDINGSTITPLERRYTVMPPRVVTGPSPSNTPSQPPAPVPPSSPPPSSPPASPPAAPAPQIPKFLRRPGKINGKPVGEAMAEARLAADAATAPRELTGAALVRQDMADGVAAGDTDGGLATAYERYRRRWQAPAGAGSTTTSSP